MRRPVGPRWLSPPWDGATARPVRRTPGRQPEALVVADPYRTTCRVDFTTDELHDMVLPELLDSYDQADEQKISEALRAQLPVLRPDVHRPRAVPLDG